MTNAGGAAYLTVLYVLYNMRSMKTQVEPEEVAIVFGANVRARRLKLGLTQEELAEKIGTYASHVSAIESGSKSIRLPNVAVWANALETTPDALLREPKKSA